MKYTVFLTNDDALEPDTYFAKLENLPWSKVLALLEIAKAQNADILIRMEAGD